MFSIAAVNELRYSAYHFSKALSLRIDPSFDKQEKKRVRRERADQYQRALRHCYRARFDALQATVLHFARDFKAFAEDYKTIYSEKDGVQEYGRSIEEAILFLCEENQGDTEAKCSGLQNVVDTLRPGYLSCLSLRGRYNDILAEFETQRIVSQEQSRELKKCELLISEQKQKIAEHVKSSNCRFWIGLFAGAAVSAFGVLISKWLP